MGSKQKEMDIMLVICLVVAIALSGCGPHSVWNISDRMKAQVVQERPAHEQQVFVTELSPRQEDYEIVANLDMSLNTCEGDMAVMTVLADKARELGCDAVTHLNIWHKPSGWCKRSPHASGKCVMLRDKGITDGNQGHWL